MPHRKRSRKQLRAIFAKLSQSKLLRRAGRILDTRNKLKPTVKTLPETVKQVDDMSVFERSRAILEIEVRQPLRTLNMLRSVPVTTFKGRKKPGERDLITQTDDADSRVLRAAWKKGFVIDLKRKHIFLRIKKCVGERGD